MAEDKYKRVNDTDLLSTWVCSECQEEAQYPPDWYQNNGTPSCCDVDMHYSHTDIKGHWINSKKEPCVYD
jgi:hypothetical protein